MDLVPWILLGCAAVGMIFYGLAVVATIWHTRRPPFRVDDAELPPVTLLKPIKGAEEALAENLRTFYVQDYPGELEVVVSTTEHDDPALEIARRIAAENPH